MMIQYKKGNLTVFQSVLYMTTTAILESDEVMVMTDPNWLPHEVERIREYVIKNIGNRQLYIIYTHSDYDHIIGAGAFTEAMVIASKSFHEKLNKEEVLEEIFYFDQQYYLERNYAIEYPKVDFVIRYDGQKLELGAFTLTFYLAPGHTEDSIFTVVEPDGILLAGDYLSDIEFPFIYSSYRDYQETIQKAENLFKNHRITTLVPGHGRTTDERDEMKRRMNITKYYLKDLIKNDWKLEAFLRKEYTFYEGMKGTHIDNTVLARKEILKPKK